MGRVLIWLFGRFHGFDLGPGKGGKDRFHKRCLGQCVTLLLARGLAFLGNCPAARALGKTDHPAGAGPAAELAGDIAGKAVRRAVGQADLQKTGLHFHRSHMIANQRGEKKVILGFRQGGNVMNGLRLWLCLWLCPGTCLGLCPGL